MEDVASAKHHRYMVEDIAVTPFFKRHRKHMPVSLKLHAELREEKDYVVLEADVSGFTQEDLQVEASHNTINISMVLGNDEEGQMKFKNSYVTPVPVDPQTLELEHKKDTLIVRLKKK